MKDFDSEIVIYRTNDGNAALEVSLRGETLWLNQSHMSLLFDRDRSVITKHLSNIFKSGELDKKSNVQKMHIAGSEISILKDIPAIRNFRIVQLLQNLQRLEILLRSKVLKMNSKDLKEQNMRKAKL